MNFLKSFAKFSIGTWVQAFLALISTPIIAWFITPDDFGMASMFILAYKLISNIVLLGGDQGFARYYNEEADTSVLLRATLYPVLFLIILSTIIIAHFNVDISILLFGNHNHSVIINLLSLTIASGVLMQLGLIAIRMEGKGFQYSIVQIVQAVVNFVVVLLYANFLAKDFSAIIVGLVVSQIIGLALVICFNINLWTKVFQNFADIDKKRLKLIYIYSLPFVPTFLLDWLFQGADKTFLRIYSDFNQIGLYATASKIAFGLNIIQTGFTAFWLPYSFNQFKNYPEEKLMYSKIFNNLVLVFGVIILLLILIQNFILFILPVKYQDILTIFPILLFIPMLYTLSEVTVVGVNFMEKTVQHLYIIIFSLLVNVSFAYLLIPKTGALGASIAMVFGYFIFFVARTIYGRKNYYIDLDIKRFVFALILIFIPVIFTVLAINNLYLISIVSLIGLFLLYSQEIKKIKDMIL
jgi:O-antigen/teichoic acid export membrane protein